MQLQSPTRTDPVARWASEVIGGPVGRLARAGRDGGMWAVSVLTALGSAVLALGVLQKNHCVSQGWQGDEAVWRMCYSDIPNFASTVPASPYAPTGSGASQPVVTAVLTWILQKVTPAGSSPLNRDQLFYAGAAVILVFCLAAAVVALVWMNPTDPWRAAHVALSPVLVTSALISFDLLAVALCAFAMAAWARRRPEVAGALLGVAICARSYPAVILAAIVLVAVRDERRADLRRLLVGAGAAVAVSILVGFALRLLGTAASNPFTPYQQWWNRGVEYGSYAKVLQLFDINLAPGFASVIAVVGWMIALGVGVVLAQRYPALPVAPLATVMLVLVMLTAKANPVQEAVWFLPLIAASALPWRDHLVWAGGEIVFFVMTWLHVGSVTNPKGLPLEGYVVFLIAHFLLLIWLATMMVRAAVPSSVRRFSPRTVAALD